MGLDKSFPPAPAPRPWELRDSSFWILQRRTRQERGVCVRFPKVENPQISTEASIYFEKFKSEIMTTEITKLKKNTHCRLPSL